MPYSIDASDRRVFLKISFILTKFFLLLSVSFFPCLSSSVVIFWFGILIFWFLLSFRPNLESSLLLLLIAFPPFRPSLSLSLSRLSSRVNCERNGPKEYRESAVSTAVAVVGHTPTYRRRRGGGYRFFHLPKEAKEEEEKIECKRERESQIYTHTRI